MCTISIVHISAICLYCLLLFACIVYCYLPKWKTLSKYLCVWVYTEAGPALVNNMQIPPQKDPFSFLVQNDAQCSETNENKFPKFCNFLFLRYGRFSIISIHFKNDFFIIPKDAQGSEMDS